MIRRTLAALALGAALTVLAPATMLAKDRDDRRSEEVRRERDRDDRYRGDRDDRYRDRDGRYRDRDDRYRNGYYDQYGYWHPDVRR